MNEMIHIDLSIDPGTMSVPARKELLERLDNSIAQHLIYKGRILASLAKDGVRIAQDFHYIVLQRVGDGSVVPELFITFQSSPRLLYKLSLLPIAEQQRAVDGEPIEFVEMTAEGPQTRMVPVNELRGAEVNQVFEGCRIRSAEMQIRWLKRKELKSREITSDARIHFHGHKVVIGGVRLSRKQLQELIDRL